MSKQDDFVMKYSEAGSPGVLIMDLPRIVEKLTNAELGLIELLTDVGKKLEGSKYGGSEVILASHLVIFSNSEPPEMVLHKKVHYLEVHLFFGHSAFHPSPFEKEKNNIRK